MIYNKIKTLLFASLICTVLAACTNIDSVSDANDVISFRVKTHAPQEIVLGDAELVNDTVYIPIIYGKYEFPMKFTAEIKTSPSINRIIGVDFATELQLDGINSSIEFFIVAQSGATRKYIIRPKEIPLEENNYIFNDVRFNFISPANSIISKTLHTDLDGENVNLYGVEINYPVAVKPIFKIAETSRFGNFWHSIKQSSVEAFVNGESSFIFSSADDVYSLTVIAESGQVKEWKISLANCININDQPALPSQSIYIDPKTLETSTVDGNGLIIDESRLDNDNCTINLRVNTTNQNKSAKKAGTKAAPIESALKVNIKMPTSEWVDLVGMKQDTTFTFIDYSDQKVFYILDPQTKESRKWTISITEYKSNLADVLTFSYDYDAALIRSITGGPFDTPSIVMDRSKVGIYPNDKTIILSYISYQNDNRTTRPYYWGLTLKDMKLTVTSGAKVEEPKIEWIATGILQANNLVKQSRTFDVVSEDGSVSTWNILLMPVDQALSSACDINSMMVDKVIPTYTQLESNEASIDYENKEIVIRVKNDDGAYPMKIYPSYDLSQFATVESQSKGLQPLVFDTAETINKIIIKAQDGTEKIYNIRLFSPIKAEGADVTNINFGAISPAGFIELSTPTYDSENGTVTLHLESEDIEFPISVSYDGITITDQATITIPNKGVFKFNKPADRIPIMVKAQSGKTKIWYIKLDYRPQLKNWKLDSWIKRGLNKYLDIDPFNYWATANGNLSGVGTTPVDGSSGITDDKAAALKTAVKLDKVASGSAFLGWFDANNVLAALNDPVIVTFFGVPFSPTAKIKGVNVDIWYHPEVVDQDWASVALDLINWDGKNSYVYHGNRPGNTPADTTYPHPDNTATRAASGSIIIGTGASVNKYNDKIFVVKDREWVKNVFIPINGNVKFTHINFVCSSSAYGDYFTGISGSELRVDNVRLIYE